MILQSIIVVMLDVVSTFFDLLPDLPDIPSAIESGADWAVTTVEGVAGFLNYLYTPTLLSAIVVVGLALLAFDTLYSSTMWAIKKIPFINIK